MIRATASRADTRSRIVDAAARLLHQEGPALVTTRGVAERAGVQAPTIYRLFGDKDGLLEAVAEHVLATYVSTKAGIAEAASAAELDPLEDLRAGWEAQIEFSIANPAVFRLLNDPNRALRSPAAQAGTKVLRARVHRLAATGRLRVGEQHAVDLIQAGGVGAVQMLLTTPVEHRDPHLADAMFEAVLGQILLDPRAHRAGATAASAVAFRAVVPDLHTFTDAERQLLAEWVDRAIDAL